MEGYIHQLESFGCADGPGSRFIIFFSGCPLRCLYCHNPDTWKMTDGKLYSVEELVKEALSEFDSIGELKEAVNDFIKANDWTGCLGNEGSGERERGLAIEGCIDHADVSKDDDSSNEELFESIFRESQPAGWAVMVNGKIWDNGFEEERARKVAAWLKSLFTTGCHNLVKVFSTNVYHVFEHMQPLHSLKKDIITCNQLYPEKQLTRLQIH